MSESYEGMAPLRTIRVFYCAMGRLLWGDAEAEAVVINGPRVAVGDLVRAKSGVVGRECTARVSEAHEEGGVQRVTLRWVEGGDG